MSHLDPSHEGVLAQLYHLLQGGSLYADNVIGHRARLEPYRLTGVRRVIHEVLDYTPIITDRVVDHEAKTVFDWDLPADGVRLDHLYNALWASYLLCLEATVGAGTNPRAHIGDQSLVDEANELVKRLGLQVTPWTCVYGSDGAYWDCTACTFDPSTQTLTLRMYIGS